MDGHSVPCLADMNDDGELDLLVGEGSGLFPGRVRLYLISDDDFDGAKRTVLTIFDAPKPLR